MAHIEPGQALPRLERALRQVMTHCYARDYGTDWLRRVADEAKRGSWGKRAREEASKREKRGVVSTPAAGLEYANLHDLREILRKHWQPVAPALGRSKEVHGLLAEVEPVIKRFDDLRNTVAHSRDLLPFEEDLLAGIAGDIENRVTIYMSSQDPDGDIYPRITSLRDSFGFAIPGDHDQASAGMFKPQVVVRPGASVIFTCSGVDPQGRELEWSLGAYSGQRMVEAVGTDVTLRWDVTNDHVREMYVVAIDMSARGAKYHRHGREDQTVYLSYKVLPPLGA